MNAHVKRKSNKQLMMPGSDTDLSELTEGYLEAVRSLSEMEAIMLARREKLITLMTKKNIRNFTHDGYRISFRAGRVIKNSIVLQQF